MSQPALAIISEPDPRIRHVLRVELSRADWTVLVAANSDEVEYLAAQAAAHMTAAQVIVLDVSTVRLRGYSACARIRRRAGYEHRPIILTARTVDSKDAAAAGKAGATALLAKPYSVGDLFDVIRSHLAADDELRATLPRTAEHALDWRMTESRGLWETGLRNGEALLSVRTASSVRIPLFRTH